MKTSADQMPKVIVHTVNPKILQVFTILNLGLFVFILNLSAFAQNFRITPHEKKDTAWVKKLLADINRRELANKDTNRATHKWVGGKVLYSSDGSLKAAQLIAATDTFNTTVQYVYNGKVFEQHFDYTDLSNFRLDKIYRLPEKIPSYLFLLSKIEYQSNFAINWLKDFYNKTLPNTNVDFRHIRTISYAAVELRLKNDSLGEVTFPPSSDDNDAQDENSSDPADSVYITKKSPNADTYSFGFISYIKGGRKFLKPFLNYDTVKHSLSFLNVYCKECDDNGNNLRPVLNVESGTYQYKDTSFVIVTDKSYYYPTLKELNKIVARRNYKAGNFIIKVKEIEGYEEGYGGYFYPTRTIEYRIGKQTLTSFNDDDTNEDNGKIDLKPNYRLRKNSSLILLLDDETNGHGPGMCGSGSHSDLSFWLIHGKTQKQLFSFSTSSCYPEVRYTYNKRNGEEISNSFYLIDPSEDRDYNIQCENSYWKNNSTYVFVISDGAHARNFYLHFTETDKKSPVRLKAGKIYNKKMPDKN